MSDLSCDFEIRYSSHDFPRNLVNKTGELQTTWNELLWAALTIGRPNRASLPQHGFASLHEALFRIHLVGMALEQTRYSYRLNRTDAFRALDPTEKGAVSYFLGMAVCKLFSSRLLNTPWLLHLDVFRDQLNAETLGGRSRPDLIGMDASGEWHAFETKGRSSAPSSEDERKAKAQAQRLVCVDGKPCSLHIGSFSFFRQDELEFYWRDPEPENPALLESIAIDVHEEYWANYYAPALSLATEPGSDLHAALVQGIGLKVEIYPKVRDLLLESQWKLVREKLADLRVSLDAEGFQADGLRVVVDDSWRRKSRVIARS